MSLESVINLQVIVIQFNLCISNFLFSSPSSIMAETASPLKHFVLAKKAITEIFDQLLEFVTEGSHFVEGEFL